MFIFLYVLLSFPKRNRHYLVRKLIFASDHVPLLYWIFVPPLYIVSPLFGIPKNSYEQIDRQIGPIVPHYAAKLKKKKNPSSRFPDINLCSFRPKISNLPSCPKQNFFGKFN